MFKWFEKWFISSIEKNVDTKLEKKTDKDNKIKLTKLKKPKGKRTLSSQIPEKNRQCNPLVKIEDD